VIIMSDYAIRPYTSEDNAALAVMWNESDDQWPGTFTEGVPMTEEIVRDWMDKETCLMHLVVENGADASIVGYGSLWATAGRDDSCYVALLNVHPAHQKRSLARRMLTQMVDWATENGYSRVTIETWPANLKSVPLYKKVGFHWTPDTSVYMENYIPTVRQLEVGRRFFEQRDWYTTFKREIKQVEDDQRHPATDGMKVFVFRWEDGDEFLEAVIDRQGQSLTGLEAGGFAAYAFVDESEPAQGIAYPVRWQVVNWRDEPLDVSILAQGETGVDLAHRESFALAAGEGRTVEASFVCAVDAPALEKNPEKPAPKIKTTMVIGGEVVELGTGLSYRPAVEIGAEPEFPSLVPGEPKTIHLHLRNRADRVLRGSVQIAPQDGLTTDWQRHDFEVEAKGYAGLPLTVTCDRAGAVPLVVTATFADGEKEVTTAPQHISLLVTPLGGVSADQGKHHVVVENDFFQITCRPKGGLCRIWSKDRQQVDLRLQDEVGPPFAPADLYEKQFNLGLEQGPGWAKVTATAKSGNFPGLAITREITVTGSPLMEVRYRMVNNAAVPYRFQVQPNVRFFDIQKTRVALPHRERLVIERASEFPSTEGDLPKKPELLAEQWMAFMRDGQMTGVVWSADVVEHEMWWEQLHLYFAERTLEPQSAVSVGPLYLYAGPGGWRDARRIWQRAKGLEPQREALPVPARPHDLGLLPDPLVTLSGRAEAQLHVDSVREFKLEGRVVIEPPPGWVIDRAELPLEGVAREKPLSETVRLTATGDRVGAASGQLRLEGAVFDEVRPFTVIRLGDESAAVCIERGEQAEHPVWKIDNGRCAWTIAPAYQGGVIAWRESGAGQKPKASAKEEARLLPNQLMTAFPENGELGWLKPWFGGVCPMVIPASEGDRGWPGKLHEETFAAAPLEVTDERGLPWRGVQLTTAMKRDEFEGIRAEIAYLTVGDSNVLKMVYRLVNETSVYRHFRSGLLAFLQVDGQHKNTVLYGDGYQRKRTSQMSYTYPGPWGAAVNPDTGRALAMVGASGERLVELANWGVDGGHLFFYNRVTLAPQGSHELVAYLALTESLEEAQRYGQLAMTNDKLRWSANLQLAHLQTRTLSH
jgi:ribosomal protein S18 acetylase RimI-like enzyme